MGIMVKPYKKLKMRSIHTIYSYFRQIESIILIEDDSIRESLLGFLKSPFVSALQNLDIRERAGEQFWAFSKSLCSPIGSYLLAKEPTHFCGPQLSKDIYFFALNIFLPSKAATPTFFILLLFIWLLFVY